MDRQRSRGICKEVGDKSLFPIGLKIHNGSCDITSEQTAAGLNLKDEKTFYMFIYTLNIKATNDNLSIKLNHYYIYIYKIKVWSVRFLISYDTYFLPWIGCSDLEKLSLSVCMLEHNSRTVEKM